MKIHIIKPCSAFNYQFIIEVSDYKSDNKSREAAIIVKYNNKSLVIPLANIAAIEE